MSRAEEIVLKDLFVDFSVVYVQTFAVSYGKCGCAPEEYGRNLLTYRRVIKEFAPEIFRAAATAINSYLNLYSVRAASSPDEYKIIYFLGRAIERRLEELGCAEIAQVHMHSLVGLLDYRLRTLGIDKPHLRKAMIKLIRSGRFDEQLGQTGGYLIYKTCSTTKPTV